MIGNDRYLLWQGRREAYAVFQPSSIALDENVHLFDALEDVLLNLVCVSLEERSELPGNPYLTGVPGIPRLQLAFVLYPKSFLSFLEPVILQRYYSMSKSEWKVHHLGLTLVSALAETLP